MVIPNPFARVLRTASVATLTPDETRYVFFAEGDAERWDVARHMAMASAAAVASSRRDALAIGRPVSEEMMVW
jgi:hypothetical protein